MSRIGLPRSKRSLRFSSHRPKRKTRAREHLAGIQHLLRGSRWDSTNSTSGIPPILWYTVAVGALINMITHMAVRPPPSCSSFTWGTISFYLGTVISVIALMDNPYRGELGLVTRCVPNLIYHQVMGL